MELKQETARDLMHGSVTPLSRNNRGTVSSSLHKKWYDGPLARWDLFEKQVYEFSTRIESLPETVLSVQPNGLTNSGNHVWKERYLCGDELSVSGRFVQQVLQPVSTVACELEMPRLFGDFKVCDAPTPSKVKLPDFVSVGPHTDMQSSLAYRDIPIESYHKLRLVGEAKTPWAHRLEVFAEKYNSQNPTHTLRRALGQIVEYMLLYKMKYGFVTTYNKTIFVKQEYREKHGNWAVYMSNLIDHSAETHVLRGVNDKTHPIAYEGKVSLRQCILYLLHCIDDFEADNPTKLADWIRAAEADVTEQEPATPESAALDVPLVVGKTSRNIKERLEAARGIPVGKSTTQSTTANKSDLADKRTSGTNPQTFDLPERHKQTSERTPATYDLIPTQDGNFKFLNRANNKYQKVSGKDVQQSEGKYYAKIGDIIHEVTLPEEYVFESSKPKRQSPRFLDSKKK